MHTSLLIDAPAAGSWNMALDEALLVSATDRATLRFYTWEAPTLSLGYFQSHAERATHRASHSCAMVRRATGGGAIVHDRELTYSFVAPIGDRLSADVGALYDEFHETLVETLADWKVPARLCEGPAKHPAEAEPFLCFQRRSPGDVICGKYKITGSAQRRHRGAVLQHGSILLSQSEFAPELPGIAELTGTSIPPADLIAAWSPRLAKRLEMELVLSLISAELATSARRIEAEKFAAIAWTERR